MSEGNLHTTRLAVRIKTARKTARLSQSMLAKQIGVTDKSISAYEQGRSTPPFEKLRKIALVTNHSLGFFTEESNDKAVIVSKLAAIETQLSDIKKLLEKKSTET